MKLHRLELTGFGPFRDTQTVDFDAFDADGLFLISGRTGAGKSSILDGVSFALYGSVPRYDGGERRLRSDHCGDGDPTRVRLEFTVADRRLRVTRAPEYDRPAKRGTGLVTEPTSAELEELVGDTWIGVAAKPREVGIELSEVLGLTAVQFQQVILLAQNKFSRFLLASGEERQALLRTLFDTKRFAGYEAELEERRRQAQKQLDIAGERVGILLDQIERLIADHDLGSSGDQAGDLAGRRDSADAARQRADYRVETAADALARADRDAIAAAAALSEVTARVRAAGELAAVRARYAEIEESDAAIDADRRTVAVAIAAETLRAPLAAATREAAARAAAMDDAGASAERWRIIAGGPGNAAGDGADESADAAIVRLTGAVAVARTALAQETALDRAQAELDRHASALAALDDELAALESAVAALPAESSSLDERLSAARAQAQTAPAARERHAAVSAALAAAEERDRLAPQLADAEAAYLSAAAESATASASLTSLLQRRVHGMAAELATGLVDGEPCAVCGSVAHPAPAQPADDLVTDADLAAAETLRDDVATGERRAADAARAFRDRHAAAAAVAGDADADALREARDGLDAEIARAEAAEHDLETLSAAVDQLARRAQELGAERDRLIAQRGAELAAEAAQRAQADAARAHVDAARGDFPTVADRVVHLEEMLAVAQEAVTTASALAERVRAHEAAVADLDDRVERAGFGDAAAAAAALLDDDARRVLENRIGEHDAARRSTRERLLALELELSGREPVDGELDAATAAAGAADAARTSAISAHRDAERTARDLRERLDGLSDAFDAVSAAADAAAVLIRFADTVAGRAPNTRRMDLETFVLAAELEEIVAAANLRLAEMSSGRYTLHHSDAKAARGRASGLDIEVLDAHTGRRRSPHSLSGGETFLASLALALGLAEVVTHRAGGLRLDTLFVDEGFGSLDPETLDLAMRTLDELRAGGRTVGLISHVEAMKEQLPAQLVVEAGLNGPSRIRQDTVAPA